MNKTLLFLFSATGLLVVNNLFLYWQFFEFDFNTFKSNTIGIALFLVHLPIRHKNKGR